MNPQPADEYDLDHLNDSDVLVQFIFDLSNTVKIEKRVVVSLTSMLGEVGGLYGILVGLAYFILGKIPEKLFLIHQVKALFRAADLDKQKD